jgi:toxin-antitoxin system PIN domain toxin
VLVDANLLLYAVDRTTPQHEQASAWLQDALNGARRVGLPWQTIGAFLRIVTHPRVATRPLTGPAAWAHVRSWLDTGPAWIPPATERTASIYGELASTHGVTGNLVPDAMLAALAIEHGLTVMSADTDFGRFPEASWVNPLLP